jgi:hypothetical protein
MTAAELIVDGVRLWLWVGAAVALVFLTIGIDRIDEDARGAYVFRPLLVPAVLVLWPLILWRWWVLETGRDRAHARYQPPRAIHLTVAIALAIAIAAALLSGLSIRQTWPTDIAPERLEAPE